MDYLKLIRKYIHIDSPLYKLYMVHVTLVTQKALEIADKLNLSPEKKKFIEEASMLHDIGIFKTNTPQIYCFGDDAYERHILIGHSLLKEEGLKQHAEVALLHTGVGIFISDIEKLKLDLPKRDFIAKTLEQKIISYADIFFSKNPKQLFKQRTVSQARQDLSKFSQKHVDIFDKWSKLEFD